MEEAAEKRDVLIGDQVNPEFEMNAYVLMPNAVNLLLQSHEFDFEKHVGAARDEVVAALARLLEAKPNAMAEYLASISQAERNILHRCLLVCLKALDEYAFEQRLGLPKDVSGEVLEMLVEAGRASRDTPFFAQKTREEWGTQTEEGEDDDA